MSSLNTPDYDYWIKLPSWSIREAVLLLHEKDPNTPNYNSNYISDKSNPESVTRRKIISAKKIKDLEGFGKKEVQLKPFKLLKWASNPDLGIIVPIELSTWLKKKLEEEDLHIAGKSHGKAEKFAANRELVMGAAFVVFARYKGQATDSKGKPTGNKIAKLIEQHQSKLFPEKGVAPLLTETMARLINKWLRKINP